MFVLENEVLHVKLAAKGAELQSIVHKSFGIEYLWGGDPAFWAKHSPVLFPIVGSLKNNSYTYQGKSYQLSRHGFVEMEFAVENQSRKEFHGACQHRRNQKITLRFRIRIRYQLMGDELSTEYLVSNTGTQLLLFS
jgi:galactose mutarotase-like enzyme